MHEGGEDGESNIKLPQLNLTKQKSLNIKINYFKKLIKLIYMKVLSQFNELNFHCTFQPYKQTLILITIVS